MNRRDFLTLAGLSALFPSGIVFPKKPRLFGWEAGHRSRLLPFGKRAKHLRHFGEGKVACLWRPYESVVGRPWLGHSQVTGDCLQAGTLVTMADGARKTIETIKAGERVLSGFGLSRIVTRTIRKPFHKRMIRFNALGALEDIVCTPDHLILVEGGKWKPAGALKIEDKVYLQSYRDKATEKTYDLLDICPDAETNNEGQIRVKSSSKWVNRYIHLDEELAFVIGAYLAEGGCSQGKKDGNWCDVLFNLGITEDKFATRVSNIMERVFGISCKIYSVPSKPTVKYVECLSKAVANFFKHLMPGNTYTKEVPNDILIASKNIQYACLLGWLEGDGSCKGRKQCKRDSKDRSPRCSGVSVSKELIIGMSRLANNCGLSPKTGKRGTPEHKAQAYIIYFNVVDTCKIYPEIAFREYEDKQQSNLGICRPLKKVSTISRVHTTVYCLDVEEDHSFIANGYTVHNCVGHATASALDLLITKQIAVDGKNEQWIAPTSVDMIYSGGRNLVADYKLRGAGMMGSWALGFVNKWGVLLRIAYPPYDLAPYTRETSRELDRNGPPESLLEEAKKHPLLDYAPVNSADEARDSIAAGYPVMMCSWLSLNNAHRDAEGFVKPRGNWSHAMLLAGVDTEYSRKGFLVINSHSDSWSSGPIRHDQPSGCSVWIDYDVIDRQLRNSGDSYSLSLLKAWPKPDNDYILW